MFAPLPLQLPDYLPETPQRTLQISAISSVNTSGSGRLSKSASDLSFSQVMSNNVLSSNGANDVEHPARTRGKIAANGCKLQYIFCATRNSFKFNKPQTNSPPKFTTMPTLSELAFAKENLLQCSGYDSGFINNSSNINAEKTLSAKLKKLLPAVEGNNKGILNYTGMSVFFNTRRKLPFFSAYNIDGKEDANAAGRPKFRTDPRMKKEQQLDFPFYDLRKDITEFEIGHMASNNEMGRGENGQLKAYQTFHFTNSVPQAEKLNTGIWKGLETYIITEAATIKSNKRICVFTGPMLKDNDPKYVEDTSFRIPILFFKVIVFPTAKGIFSTAFMMSHEKKLVEDDLIEAPPSLLPEGEGLFDDFKFKKVFQVNVSFLENETGLKFTWPGVKKVKIPDGINEIKKIKSIKDAKEAEEAIKDSTFPVALEDKFKPHEKAAAKKSIEKGLVPEPLLSNADLTPKELKQKKFKLNIVLPR